MIYHKQSIIIMSGSLNLCCQLPCTKTETLCYLCFVAHNLFIFIYRRFFPGSKRSTFTDSMNPRSTGTTDIEQSTKSVDSMVDNPTYCVPFPVDYHEVSIYPQKKTHPPVFPMNSLTKGVSSIDMVDNECYCVPSSLSGRDDMEQSLVAGQQFPPLEYETPK